MGEPERRRFIRVPRAFVVRYQRPNRTWSVSTLRDLSLEGAGFLSEDAFQPGSTLELQLLLPNSKEPLRVGARVTWLQPRKMGLPQVGVQFESLGEGARRLIKQAIEVFLSRMSR